MSNYDDVGDAIREGRALREAAAYRIRFGLDGLTFRNINVPDPVPTGRQILAGAGLDHRADYILYAYLDTGDFEDVRLDEPFDLRGRGAERFIAFKSDRDFKFSLNDRQLAWGNVPTCWAASCTTSPTRRRTRRCSWRSAAVKTGSSSRTTAINLDAPGIERFITAPKPQTGYVILVNSVEETVPDKHVTFEQVVMLAHPNAPAETNVTFSMTYRNAASRPHAGELGEGGSVEVKKKGTIFNVTRTVQS
jgi:hypothetical protein